MVNKIPLYGKCNNEWDFFLTNIDGNSFFLTVGAPLNGKINGLYGSYLHRYGDPSGYISGVIPINCVDLDLVKEENIPFSKKDFHDLMPLNMKELNKFYSSHKAAYQLAKPILKRLKGLAAFR